MPTHFMDTLNSPPSLGSIQFITGSQAGESFPIYKAHITLGRDPASDIPSLCRIPLFRDTMPKLSGIMGYGQLSTSLIEIPSPSTSIMSRPVNKCPLMIVILSCLGREPPFSFRSKPMCPLHPLHPMRHPPIHSSLCKVIHQRLSLNNRSRIEPYVPQQSFPNYPPPEIQPPYQNNPPAYLSNDSCSSTVLSK